MNSDIDYLKKLMSIKSKHGIINNNFSWLYLFSNENINAFYKIFDFNNKDVLTATASGDHILNAFLYGAKNVEGFDINPLAKHFSELKIAAVKSLTREEFIMFFNKKINIYKSSKYFFDINIYKNKIRTYLSEEEKVFWDYLFNNYSNRKIRNCFLFTDDQLSIETTINVNSYLNSDENYYKLRDILKDKKVKYYDINIKDLDKINKKYDLVILSNIANYLNDIYDKEHLSNFRKLIEYLRKNNTQVVVSYLYYNSLETLNNDNPIYLKNDVKKYFGDDDFEYIKFESIDRYEYPKFVGKDDRNDEILVSRVK